MDSLKFPVSELKVFTAVEIKDSIKKSRNSKVKPILKGNQRIQNN
jgi:hypothetical protein